MKSHGVVITWIGVGMILMSSIATSETWENIPIVNSKPLNELWLNAGFYTYHFQNDLQLNDKNYGFGGEYRYSTTSSIVLGEFNNSDWGTSDYVGWYWRPIAIGSIGMGAEIGVIDGYPKFSNGGWFPLVVPVASYEYKNIGANIIVIPNFKEQMHGGISLQLKVKLF